MGVDCRRPHKTKGLSRFLKSKKLRRELGRQVRIVGEKIISDNRNGISKCHEARERMVCLKNKEELRVVRLEKT